MSAHVQSQLAQAITERDHIRGSLHAPVKLVEYGDFQCPYCGQAHLILQAIEGQMGDQLCFAFRHFPLTNIHPFAEHAAEATEAASAQGRFWDMHDMLFENQDALSDEDLVGYAAELRLDTRRFADDLVSGLYRARIREDFTTGVHSDVNGTPSFYINGMRYDGGMDIDSMMEALESQM